MTKKQKLKLEELKIKSILLLKYMIFIFIILSLIFGVYKIFNWKKIFDRDYESAKIIKKNIVLPPILRNASSTASTSSEAYSYEQKDFLEDVIKKLKRQNIEVIQIEESNNLLDVIFLIKALPESAETYKMFISFNSDRKLLFDNIISVYTDKIFKNYIENDEIKNIEYIDFRFKDKVFYKFKNSETLSSSTTDENI